MRRGQFAAAVTTSTPAPTPALLPMAAAPTGSAAAMTTAFALAAMLPKIPVLGATLAALPTLVVLTVLTARLALPFPAATTPTTAPTTRLVRWLGSTISTLILRRRIRLIRAALRTRISVRLGVRRTVAPVVTAVFRAVAIFGTVAAFRTIERALLAVISTVVTLRGLILAVCLAIRTVLATTLRCRGRFGSSGWLKMGTFRFGRALFPGRRRGWCLLSKLTNGRGRARRRGNFRKLRLLGLRSSRFPNLGAGCGFGDFLIDGLGSARGGGAGAACFLGVARFRSARGRRRIAVVFRRKGHV